MNHCAECNFSLLIFEFRVVALQEVAHPENIRQASAGGRSAFFFALEDPNLHSSTGNERNFTRSFMVRLGVLGCAEKGQEATLEVSPGDNIQDSQRIDLHPENKERPTLWSRPFVIDQVGMHSINLRDSGNRYRVIISVQISLYKVCYWP